MVENITHSLYCGSSLAKNNGEAFESRRLEKGKGKERKDQRPETSGNLCHDGKLLRATG